MTHSFSVLESLSPPIDAERKKAIIIQVNQQNMGKKCCHVKKDSKQGARGNSAAGAPIVTWNYARKRAC